MQISTGPIFEITKVIRNQPYQEEISPTPSQCGFRLSMPSCCDMKPQIQESGRSGATRFSDESSLSSGVGEEEHITSLFCFNVEDIDAEPAHDHNEKRTHQ